jgi:hypothetical protein
MNLDDPKNFGTMCKHCNRRLGEHAGKHHAHGANRCPGHGKNPCRGESWHKDSGAKMTWDAFRTTMAWDSYWTTRDTYFEPIEAAAEGKP